MATELPMPESTKAAWNELAEQSLLTHRQGQIECGRSTHGCGDTDCVPCARGQLDSCGWCGAKV